MSCCWGVARPFLPCIRFFVFVRSRVASAVMRQAHAEGVATAESAISAIEKENRAFMDDDHDEHIDGREMQVEMGTFVGETHWSS